MIQTHDSWGHRSIISKQPVPVIWVPWNIVNVTKKWYIYTEPGYPKP